MPPPTDHWNRLHDYSSSVSPLSPDMKEAMDQDAGEVEWNAWARRSAERQARLQARRQILLNKLDDYVDNEVEQKVKSVKDRQAALMTQAKAEAAEAVARHPDTLSAISNLAITLEQQGKYMEADAMRELILSKNVQSEKKPENSNEEELMFYLEP